MAALTVEQYVETGDPMREVVRVNGDDTDTYVVRKIASVQGVQVTCNTNDDADLNATWSGRTVTVNHASQTANDYTLTIIGFP